MQLLLALLALLASFSTESVMAEETKLEEARRRMLEIDMPHPGSGKLATIRSFGPNRPSEPALLAITTATEQAVSDIVRPWQIAWQDTSSLLVVTSALPGVDDSDDRLTRVAASGRAVDVIPDPGKHFSPSPSPNGQWLAMAGMTPGSGKLRLEVFEFSATSTELGEPRIFSELYPYTVAWSPDSKHLAVGAGIVEPTGKQWPRLRIVDIETGEIRKISDGYATGVRPMFWTQHGLFVEAPHGLARCDLEAGGCEVVYDPGGPRFRVLMGTPVGGDKAWVLVTDHARDPIEIRAHELHEVDLAKGGGKRLLRLPDMVYLADIDWIAD